MRPMSDEIVDVTVDCQDGTVLLVPHTSSAKEWLVKNPTPSSVRLWHGIVVQRRHAIGLLVALQEAGYTVDNF